MAGRRRRPARWSGRPCPGQVGWPARRRCRRAAGPARRRGRTRRGPSTGQLGQRLVGEAVHGTARPRTASTSREPNSSGSSAPSATGTPASRSAGAARRSGSVVDAQPHVGHRADLQRHARPRPAGRPAPGPRPTRTPWPIRWAPSASRQAATLLGPGQLATVRRRQQAGARGDPEGRREVLGAARAARRWTARSRPRRARRTARPAGPACARRTGGGCGSPRS